MRRLDSCIFCAILRRRPMSLTSRVASVAAPLRALPDRAASRSAWTTRPSGPLPCNRARSMPSARARALHRGRSERARRRCHARLRQGCRRCRCWRARRWRRCRCRCRCRWRRARLGNGSLRRRRRRGRLTLDADQDRPHRHHLPDFAAEFDHAPGHRRRDLDRRLVGHHVAQELVFGDEVARLDAPFDQFDLGDAFAEVGHADGVDRHGSITFPITFR